MFFRADLSGDIDEPSAGGSCFQVTHVFDDTVADLGKESPGGAMNEVDSISATMSADAPSPSSTLAADPMQPATPACSLGQPSDQNPECSADASKENLGLQGTEIQGPEDPQSQGCKTSVSPLPPSWMLAALSWQNMDASMVLTGISMALPGITSNLDCGDALDLELQSPGKFNAKVCPDVSPANLLSTPACCGCDLTECTLQCAAPHDHRKRGTGNR